MPVKVLIVDDQKMSRQLFESFVNHSDRYELVYALDSASEADAYPARFQIDLILMDVVMKSGMNGLEAAERIKKNYPDIKIIIVTSMAETAFLDKAKAIGVDSFWYKETDQETILSVMDRTMAGESVYPDKPPVVKLGLCDSTEFTERELEVLRVLATGCSDEEIAEKLSISVTTVRTHITHMRDKAGYKSRMELALNALRTGIVVPE